MAEGSLRRRGDGYWEWFDAADDPAYEITGKYLFFSSDRDLLVSIAVEELTKGGFHHAKIPLPEANIQKEYVLCLYYRDDSRKQELARKYRGRPKLKYRYWKSDEDTLAGKYSAEFLNRIPARMRPDFDETKKR